MSYSFVFGLKDSFHNQPGEVQSVHNVPGPRSLNENMVTVTMLLAPQEAS